MNKASCFEFGFQCHLVLEYHQDQRDRGRVCGHRGEDIDKETLSHISLLPFRHVVPNGTYFIEDV